MLFPYSLNQFATDYLLSKEYYIPQGNFVFELDDTGGYEKFYLIASAQRLQELENLFGSYESAEDFKKPEFIKLKNWLRKNFKDVIIVFEQS